MRRYVVIDKSTEQVVVEDLRSRQSARIAKRQLEYAAREANGFVQSPSKYYVETDVDHPRGAGIYSH